MTTEKFYSILKYLDTLDKSLGLQASLDTVKEALSNLVSSPAQPQYQAALATALASFESAAGKLRESITPSQAASIKEMGGEEFFEPSIADKVKTSVQMNAMTPSVASEFVQQLASKRSTFLATVRSARQSLEKLGLRESGLESNSPDIAFLIPREIFKNHLGDFAKELTFISRLMRHFSEAITGETQPVELEQLSSSIPTVALLAPVAVIGAVATVVSKFLDAWEKIERIRKIRSELTEIGMKGKAVEELTEQITTTVDEVVEESTEIVVASYQGEAGRKNELSNAIRQDTRRLFGQIERGLAIEFRAQPKTGGDGENATALQNIADLSRKMEFPRVAQEPMLLENGEIIEGELHTVKHSKKTTTQKTTSVKKEPIKEGKSE
jgi:hypothetical protein